MISIEPEKLATTRIMQMPTRRPADWHVSSSHTSRVTAPPFSWVHTAHNMYQLSPPIQNMYQLSHLPPPRPGCTQHTSCISCHHPSLSQVHIAHIMYLLSPHLPTLGTHSIHDVSLVTTPPYPVYIQHASCISRHHPSPPQIHTAHIMYLLSPPLLPWVHTAHVMYLLSPPLPTLGTYSTHHVSLVTTPLHPR